MKSVKFLKSHRMYQPGEVAGFDDTFADKLIQSGFAVPLGAKGALKTATADVLVNPADMAPPVSEPGLGEGDGVAPVNDPATPISTDSAETDPAEATVAEDGTVEELDGAQKDSSEAQEATSAEPAKPVKKSAGKKD